MLVRGLCCISAVCACTGAEYVSLEELLRNSDVVSLHTPLLPSTRHIIDAWQLELMKRTAGGVIH